MLCIYNWLWCEITITISRSSIVSFSVNSCVMFIVLSWQCAIIFGDHMDIKRHYIRTTWDKIIFKKWLLLLFNDNWNSISYFRNSNSNLLCAGWMSCATTGEHIGRIEMKEKNTYTGEIQKLDVSPEDRIQN